MPSLRARDTARSPLVSIETQAFEGCSSLTRLVFPEKTESVGLSAFSNCSGVVDITLPAGIKTIAKKAFSGCTKIQNLYIRSQYVADFLSNDSNLFDRGVNLLVYIAPGLNVNQISYLAKNDFRKLSNIPAEKDGVQYYLWQK